MNIVHVAAELAPYAATGGLAEVMSALPDALDARFADAGGGCSIILPGYKRAMDALIEAGEAPQREGELLTMHLDGRDISFAAFSVRREGRANLWLLTNIELFDRPGLYGDEHGSYGDNALRFVAFCHAARLLVLRGDLGDVDLVHAHDWHAAALPVLLKVAGGPPSVLTIHNLGYQGGFDASWLPRIGLPQELMHVEALEFHGHINLMKGGIAFADAVTTVSPTYARQILTPAHGVRLDGLLRKHAGKLSGILNGIGDDWDPAKDRAIPANFDAQDLSGKAICRQTLCEQFGVSPLREEPVFGIVSRLAWQKGMDVLADIAPGLASRGVLVVLGSGEPGLERRFQHLTRAYPGRIGAWIGYSPARARLLFAGCDAVIMPSRYEPCGLAQMQAMRYGTLPVVHATGGLRDSVEHGETGFAFEVLDGTGLAWACTEALKAWADQPRWLDLQQNAMAQDFSWRSSAGAYVDVYRGIVGDTGAAASA